MTPLTKTSGVEAPDVIPIELFPSNQSSFTSSGPLTKYASIPLSEASSFSLLLLELFFAPTTRTRSTSSVIESRAFCLFVVA